MLKTYNISADEFCLRNTPRIQPSTKIFQCIPYIHICRQTSSINTSLQSGYYSTVTKDTTSLMLLF